MKVSELIDRLQKFQDKYGDLECQVENYIDYGCNNWEVDWVNVTKVWVEIWKTWCNIRIL
jgi:hypothetical protein